MTKNASLHDLTISDFSCQPMLEKIEDKYDLEFLQQPMIEDDGIRISVQDLFDEFGTYYTNLYLQKKKRIGNFGNLMHLQ